jgi:hypothetical protein
MDGMLNSSDSVTEKSEQANAPNDPISKSRGSSKRRSKTRSKVWEKVAWFTRKTKSGRENKSLTPDRARKDHKSPSSDGVLRTQGAEESHVALNTLENTSHNDIVGKTKTKSGIRKTKSFNYLRRKKLKHYVDGANSSVLDEEAKENTDPTTCQTATGTFLDFASAGSRQNSRVASSSGNLVSEMAKEINCKQEEQLRDSIKSSLSLPLSLLSLSERPGNMHVGSQSCQGLPSSINSRQSFAGPNYNSWPRKKRLLVANQSCEAFSPPQKQKRMCSLRKTATFSGFDSFELSNKESKTTERVLRGVKSTPLLSGHNQIKNQNGLTIGVIHFFKSPQSNCSKFASIVTEDKFVSGPVLANEVKTFDLHGESSTEHKTDVNKGVDILGNVNISNVINPHLHLVSTNTDGDDKLLSKSNIKDEFLSENEEPCSTSSGNIVHLSKGLTECANIGTIVSMKECFMVEDSANELCSLTFKSPSKHLENISQTVVTEQGFQGPPVGTSSDGIEINLESKKITSSSEAGSLDLIVLPLSPQSAIDKRAVYGNLEIIKEVPDCLSKVNTENSESSKEYSKCNTLPKQGSEKDVCSLSKPTENGIYCIKIEDQVTDFSKEAKIDFQSQAKLQPLSTFSEPFVDKFQDSSYIRENTLFESADNTKKSYPLCLTTNGSNMEGGHETFQESAILKSYVQPSSVMLLKEETLMSYNENQALQSAKGLCALCPPTSSHTEEDYEMEETSNAILKDTLQLSSQKLLRGGKLKVDGPHFKNQTEVC